MRRVAQIPSAHDVVALEDGAGLVPGHLHGDTLGHARAHEVAHGGAAEVVRNSAGAAGGDPRFPPRLVESALGDALAGLLPLHVTEDVRRDDALVAPEDATSDA